MELWFEYIYTLSVMIMRGVACSLLTIPILHSIPQSWGTVILPLEEVQWAVEFFFKYHVYVVTMRLIWPGKFKNWGYKNIDAGTESIRHISLQWETECTELRSSTLARKSFECFWISRIKERRAGVGNFANVELYQIQNLTNFHPGNFLEICSTAREFLSISIVELFLWAREIQFSIHAILDFTVHCLHQMKYVDTEHAVQERYSISDLHTDNYVIRVTISFEEITGNFMYLGLLVEVLRYRKEDLFPSVSCLQKQFVVSLCI